jgi:outer membrane protein assembly factor BamB
VTAGIAMAAAVLGTAVRGQESGRDVDGSGLYSLPQWQDDVAALQEAERDIAAKKFDAAVERLHKLLVGRRSNGVIPVPGAVDRWTGLRLAVIRTLRDLPEAGHREYERLAQREAGARFHTDTAALRPDELLHLAESFPTASAGIRARIRLGDLALEAGHGIAAEQHYRAALDAVPERDELARSLAMRHRAADLLARSDAASSWRDDGAFADDLRAIVASGGDSTWPAYGGGRDGRRPMQPPEGDCSRFHALQIHAEGFAYNMFPMHAVGDLTGIFVNDGLRVWALDPIAQRVQWQALGGMADAGDADDARNAINSGMILACAVDSGVVVASLQVPNDVVGATHTRRFQNSISIIEKIPSRRLFAFDRTTGKRIWAHWDYKNGPLSTRFDGHDSCSAPLISGDTVYAATHDQTGAIAFYLSAYDLHTGETRWRRLICSSQQEVNMFGNARQEFAAGPIALHGGVLYGTTNLGVCFAADADDGEIRWISGYEVIPLPRTQLHNQESRPVFFANSPIVIHDGVLATTPLDSPYAIGIDTETGQQLWRVPYERAGGRPDMAIRWLLGVFDDEFVFAGLGILGVKPRPTRVDPRLVAETRVIASAESLDEVDYRVDSIPRGAVTEDRIWFLGSRGLLRILDSRSNRDPRMNDLRLSGVGNLLLVDGLAVLCRNGAVSMHGDLASLIRAAERHLVHAPNDPAALLRLASLARAQAGDDVTGVLADRAEAAFEKGLDSAAGQGLGIGSPIYRKLAQGLFQISFDRATAVAATNPGRGLTMLRQARERAVLPEQWLTAQQSVLALSTGDPETYLAELELMASRHGDLTHRFADVGQVPVAAFALWQSLPFVRDPAEAAARCQELMERFGSVSFARTPVGRLASDQLAELIARHGRSIYARIEARAADALAAAGDDRQLLRALAERFPHSQAAAESTGRLLDIAVAAGDLRTAASSFASAAGRGHLAAGIVRRMQVAAQANGNLGLAAALGRWLDGEVGESTSDYPPDGGKTYREVQAMVPAPSAPARPGPSLPEVELARIEPPNLQSTISLVPIRFAAGFAVPPDVPLYASTDDTLLQAFALERLPGPLGDALFATPARNSTSEPPFLCGDALVVIESDRIRGIDYRSGRERWEVRAETRRELQSLGIRDGVLHLFSAIESTGGDGGRLIGVEPRSGAILFTHVFDPLRDSMSPVSCAAGILALDPGGQSGEPRILRIDTVTGARVAETPLRPEVLQFLGLRDQRFRLHNQDLQTDIFADGDTVFVPVNQGDGSGPRLAAIRFDGTLRWRWTGADGLALHMAAATADRIVLVERGPKTGRLTVLAKDGGSAQPPVVLGQQIVIHNWRRSTHHEPAPGALLISDVDRGARLVCVSLDGRTASFKEPLQNVNGVLRDPVLGDDFVLVPVLRVGRPMPSLWVLDLATRRGALPNGESELGVQANRPLKVYAHDRYVILDTLEGLFVLGHHGSRNR